MKYMVVVRHAPLHVSIVTSCNASVIIRPKKKLRGIGLTFPPDGLDSITCLLGNKLKRQKNALLFVFIALAKTTMQQGAS